MGPLCFMKGFWQMANNRINSDWQFRCAPLPAGYAERWAAVVCLSKQKEVREQGFEGIGSH
jgi:hypothetical protein